MARYIPYVSVLDKLLDKYLTLYPNRPVDPILRRIRIQKDGYKTKWLDVTEDYLAYKAEKYTWAIFLPGIEFPGQRPTELKSARTNEKSVMTSTPMRVAATSGRNENAGKRGSLTQQLAGVGSNNRNGTGAKSSGGMSGRSVFEPGRENEAPTFRGKWEEQRQENERLKKQLEALTKSQASGVGRPSGSLSWADDVNEYAAAAPTLKLGDIQRQQRAEEASRKAKNMPKPSEKGRGHDRRGNLDPMDDDGNHVFGCFPPTQVRYAQFLGLGEIRGKWLEKLERALEVSICHTFDDTKFGTRFEVWAFATRYQQMADPKVVNLLTHAAAFLQSWAEYCQRQVAARAHVMNIWAYYEYWVHTYFKDKEERLRRIEASYAATRDTSGSTSGAHEATSKKDENETSNRYEMLKNEDEDEEEENEDDEEDNTSPPVPAAASLDAAGKNKTDKKDKKQDGPEDRSANLTSSSSTASNDKLRKVKDGSVGDATSKTPPGGKRKKYVDIYDEDGNKTTMVFSDRPEDEDVDKLVKLIRREEALAKATEFEEQASMNVDDNSVRNTAVPAPEPATRPKVMARRVYR